MENKNFFESKTLWMSALTAILSVGSPHIQEFISTHPGWAGISVSILFAFMRLITGQPVGLFVKK